MLLDLQDCLYNSLLRFTTNGEFNSLRWKGNKRPLSVLQVRSDVRAWYQRKGLNTLMEMITPMGMLMPILSCSNVIEQFQLIVCV